MSIIGATYSGLQGKRWATCDKQPIVYQCSILDIAHWHTMTRLATGSWGIGKTPSVVFAVGRLAIKENFISNIQQVKRDLETSSPAPFTKRHNNLQSLKKT